MDLLSPKTAYNAEAPPRETSEMGGEDSPFFNESDLCDDTELKNLMAQLNPLAVKDIGTIEKGVEHYFLFHQSHLALIRKEQMQYLTPADIIALADRNALRPFSYLDYDINSGTMYVRNVLIRPASLKAEQVRKVKQGCVRGSAAALLEYINARDRRLLDLEREDELGRWVSNRFIKTDAEGAVLSSESRKSLNTLLANVRSLSFEFILENEIGAPEELTPGIIKLLAGNRADLESELSQVAELSPQARDAMNSRGNQSILFTLSPELHLLNPITIELIEIRDGKINNIHCELEWVHLLFIQLARKILQAILPEEERSRLPEQGPTQDQIFLKELKKHPSLTGGDWSNAENFIYIFEASIKRVRYLKQIRKEFLIEQIGQDTLQKLNMLFEPYFFNKSQFSVSSALAEIFKDKDELFNLVAEKIKENPEVLAMEERRENTDRAEGETPGLFLIFRYNLARSFVQNKNRRNFLHLMARTGGHEKGIYDLLIEVKEGIDPPEIIDEQIKLARSIREWEEELEKERRKKEKSGQSFFTRIVNFFKRLFGGDSEFSPKKDGEPGGKGERGDADPAPTARGVLVGPKERSMKVPVAVQKAIEEVDRKNNGIIWLDEVIKHMGSTKFTPDMIGDMLHYDEMERYQEVRPLIKIRRTFIIRQDENDPKWLQSSIDYLDNIHNAGPEHKTLSDYLKQKL